jgi:uncharacterized protein (DUF1015 family)
MAEIKPFRAWRYSDQQASQIDELTSPLFDVVSEKQIAKLYQHPYNSIYLSVPTGEHPIPEVVKLLQKWKNEGIIVQDAVPSIYVYYQYFSLPGSSKDYCRKGFICNIKAYDWSENVILRHENTIPGAVDSRKELLANTLLNVSPTHGLYTDASHTIEAFLDESMTAPIYETEDYQGVKDKLSVIQDARIINKIIALLKDKKIILADGHHRYEGSMNYRKEMIAMNPDNKGDEAYHYHMMYFTNTESDDLRILPTHRVVSGLEAFDEAKLIADLQAYFTIKQVDNVNDIPEIILGKQWAFGLIIGDNCYKIRLKPELIDSMTWQFPDAIKKLDLTVMHYFIIEKVLGIKGKDQRSSPNISFERNFTACSNKVVKGEAQFAIITKDISMDTVKEVCFSGFTLPQKSTYFYPKVICGFLFSSIQQDEFISPFDSSFQ